MHSQSAEMVLRLIAGLGSALSRSLRLATSPVPGEVDFATACAIPQPAMLPLRSNNRSQATLLGRSPPSPGTGPGTGEGLRSQAQGEGATASDERSAPR